MACEITDSIACVCGTWGTEVLNSLSCVVRFAL